MSLFIGIDLGGTNLKYAIGNAEGDIFVKKSRPTNANQSQGEIFETIFLSIEELLEEAKKRNESVEGIGVGSPGSIDFWKGQLIGSTPNIPSWTNAPIKKRIEDKFQIPVWADNDANIMALAEARKGAGKGHKNILCLTIGTGIGGGIVINKQVLRGEHFSAAEVGHIIIVKDGKKCNCGNNGCFEAYASAPAMVDRYQHKVTNGGSTSQNNDVDAQYIFEKAEAGDKFAQETVQESCEFLGAGIASISNIIDPEIVIIGGGVAGAGEKFIRLIEQEVKKYSIKAITTPLKILRAEMGNDAGIIGAIMLAVESTKKNE